MEAWGVFQRYDDMNVLDSTWLFNLKQFSEGLKNKLKPVLSLYFSAVGRSEFFLTYNHIVQWKTIWLMIILEVLLGIKYKQGDVTKTFLHADVGKG